MGRLISEKYTAWKAECEERFQQLKKNEEELNRIFIDIYGLQDELTPDVADKDITVHRIFDTKDDVPESMKGSNYVRTKRDEIVSLISYAVGCMFGRYSLDVEGLAYAGGEFCDQWIEISGQWAADSGQRSAGGGQWSADSGQRSAGSGQWSADSGQWSADSGQRSVGSGQWIAGKSRYYKREVVEYYVGKELQRSLGMAEVDAVDGEDISVNEVAAESRIIRFVKPNEESGGVDSFQYRRGASAKLYEGIRELSLNSKGLDSRAGNTVYDLCSPEILDAIASGNGIELVHRGWQDAERVDWKTVRRLLTADRFSPDSDNIIPICDDEYFEDDITGRFVDFVRQVYGEETLEENLKFVADALGGNGTPREVIRSYFLNDFYADHLKTYQKRPIYWLFDSGKKNGFKALIYMHRYQPDLLARMRTDYVHEQQERYRTQISIADAAEQTATATERVKIEKRKQKLQAQELEIAAFEEKIHHLADKMIEIDLDDGVKVNYAKFDDVLAKIK